MAAVILNSLGFYNLQSMSIPPHQNFSKTPKQRNVTAPSSAVSTTVRDMIQQRTSSSKSVTCNKLWCSQELVETRQTEKSKLREHVQSDMTYIEVTGKAEESSMIS